MVTTKNSKSTKGGDREPWGEESVLRIVHKEESYRIIGACFEVYTKKGHGFLEAVYQECLTIELAER
ncbi:MAG: GxxExxY protein [Phycisphaeraceae bacterium]|nr:GxxExxY protein [Phycisphaeraceae bacterium]